MKKRESPKSDEAESFIRQILYNGPKTVQSIEKAADEAGITMATLHKARKQLGIVPFQSKDGGYWSLPELQPEPANSIGQQARTPPPPSSLSIEELEQWCYLEIIESGWLSRVFDAYHAAMQQLEFPEDEIKDLKDKIQSLEVQIDRLTDENESLGEKLDKALGEIYSLKRSSQKKPKS